MREYVEKTLHTRVDCEPVDASGLPLYLRGLYSLERWTAFGVPFAVVSPADSPTVKTMAKHRDALEAALGTMFLMVVSSLPILAMVFVYGGVTASDLLLLVCCFFAAAVFMGSIGLCCSALFRRTTAATVAAYAVTAVLTAGTYGINFLVTYINRMRIGEYLASAESGGVSSGSGGLLYVLLVNPIATFAQVIGRLTAGNQSWMQAGTWFGNQADNSLISHWMGVSMVLQMALAIGFVLWAVRSVEKGNA